MDIVREFCEFLCERNKESTIITNKYKFMLRINCFFQANEGRYDEALQAAMALTAKSQSHQGCKAYDVFESATRPDVFMICETWQDQESLDLHAQTPEFVEYAGILNDCGLLKIEKLEF